MRFWSQGLLLSLIKSYMNLAKKLGKGLKYLLFLFMVVFTICLFLDLTDLQVFFVLKPPVFLENFVWLPQDSLKMFIIFFIIPVLLIIYLVNFYSFFAALALLMGALDFSYKLVSSLTASKYVSLHFYGWTISTRIFMCEKYNYLVELMKCYKVDSLLIWKDLGPQVQKVNDWGEISSIYTSYLSDYHVSNSFASWIGKYMTDWSNGFLNYYVPFYGERRLNAEHSQNLDYNLQVDFPGIYFHFDFLIFLLLSLIIVSLLLRIFIYETASTGIIQYPKFISGFISNLKSHMNFLRNFIYVFIYLLLCVFIGAWLLGDMNLTLISNGSMFTQGSFTGCFFLVFFLYNLLYLINKVNPLLSMTTLISLFLKSPGIYQAYLWNQPLFTVHFFSYFVTVHGPQNVLSLDNFSAQDFLSFFANPSIENPTLILVTCFYIISHSLVEHIVFKAFLMRQIALFMDLPDIPIGPLPKITVPQVVAPEPFVPDFPHGLNDVLIEFFHMRPQIFLFFSDWGYIITVITWYINELTNPSIPKTYDIFPEPHTHVNNIILELSLVSQIFFFLLFVFVLWKIIRKK